MPSVNTSLFCVIFVGRRSRRVCYCRFRCVVYCCLCRENWKIFRLLRLLAPLFSPQPHFDDDYPFYTRRAKKILPLPRKYPFFPHSIPPTENSFSAIAKKICACMRQHCSTHTDLAISTQVHRFFITTKKQPVESHSTLFCRHHPHFSRSSHQNGCVSPMRRSLLQCSEEFLHEIQSIVRLLTESASAFAYILATERSPSSSVPLFTWNGKHIAR